MADAAASRRAWREHPAESDRPQIDGVARHPTSADDEAALLDLLASGTVYYEQVTTTGPFTPLVPYPGVPKSVNITGSSTMRVASQ